MSYYSDDWTDAELEALEKRIADVYKQAEQDLNKEVQEYFAKFKIRDKEMQSLADAGEITQAELQQWRLTQIGRGQRFEALRDKVAERYTQANEVATAYVNDMTPSIYSLNRNYEAYTIEKAVGSCDFTMWDESTVRRLLVQEPDVMPFYPEVLAVRRGIDIEYGKSQITKHVTSGIIRGLAPGKIANELMSSITTMNRASAVRAARTGITAAQNAGRHDSYIAAEKMGIQIKRRWICTKDSRTRLDHALADGQIVVGTKVAFKVGGYKMKFPGDRSLGAPGHELYNCRCTIRTVEKDGIEAEPRQMRVRNPEWEEAKAEETKLETKLEKLKEREQAETDPAKRKQLRKERLETQNKLSAATKKRQGLDKNVLVNEMTYSDWAKWKKSLANSGNGATVNVSTPKKTSAMRRDPALFRSGTQAQTEKLSERLSRCKTTSEVSEETQDHFIKKGSKIRIIDFGKANTEAAKQMAEMLDKLDDKYKSALTSIKVGWLPDSIGGQSTPTNISFLQFMRTGNPFDLESEIKLSEKLLKSAKAIKHDFETYHRTTYGGVAHGVMADDKYAAVATLVHEFGHTICPGKVNEIYQSETGNVNSYFMPFKRQYNVYMRELRNKQREINAVRESYAGQPDGLRLGIEAAKELQAEYDAMCISNYSKSSVGEFIAEAFADAMLNSNPKPASVKVLETIEKLYGKEQ